MKRWQILFVALVLTVGADRVAGADLLSNGNLDQTYQQEIVTGFFLPKPALWVNEGFRSISGAYEDEMSSETWAGQAPTPVTPSDSAVFFKAFSGNVANGPATAHFYQDVPGTPGTMYVFTGWAGAEANYLATRSLFAIDFLNSANSVIGSTELDLAGLFVDNGQPFDYKQYSVIATAPANTVNVRARVSMIEGIANPAGGSQAFVIDDFELTVIPEPTTVALGFMGLLGLLWVRARKSGAR